MSESNELEAPGLTLGIDTAGRHAHVALADETGLLSVASREVTTHSEHLLTLIDQLLSNAKRTADELTYIAIGIGPGSFTGLRIGLSTAKGLAYATGARIVSVSSTVPLARAAMRNVKPNTAGNTRVLVIMDAQRKELFCRLYENDSVAKTIHSTPFDSFVSELDTLIETTLQESSGKIIAISDNTPLTAQALAAIEKSDHIEILQSVKIDASELIRAAIPKILDNKFEVLASLEPQYFRAPDIHKKKS